MQLGILLSGTGYLVPSWEQGFAEAQAMGYTHVELAGNDVSGRGDKPDLGKVEVEEAQRIVARARDWGLSVSAIQSHQGFLQADRAAFEAAVAHTARMLDLAAACGIPVVHTVSGHVRALPEEQAWPQLTEAYNRLLEHARRAGVRLAIEPVFVYRVGNLATLQRLLELVEGEDLAINYDPSHFPYHDESPLPLIEQFADRIVHAHAKDAVVEPDPEGLARGTENEMPGGRRFRFAPPGQGQLDFVAIVRTLREHGYDGVLSLELGHGIADQTQAAREALTFLREVLAQVGT